MANHGGARPGGGRPKGAVDPKKKEVNEIFKEAAPGLLRKAIQEAKNGDKYLLAILVKKALPDNINLNAELDIKTLSDDQLKSRILELCASLGLVGTGNPDR